MNGKAQTLTPLYYWLLKSNGNLWRITGRRYASEREVRQACCLAPSVGIFPVEASRLLVEGYQPLASDFVEGDRQIRHSGGSAGEGEYGRDL